MSVSFLLALTGSSFRPAVILLLGDSVTLADYTEEGFAHILQEKLTGRAIVINAGFNSGTAPDALSHWEEYSALRPDIVIIYFGTNDIKRIDSGNETWEEYESALLKLATLAPRAILITPHRGHETPAHHYYLADVERAASLVRNLGYPVADIYSYCCEENQLCDYAHPNEEGHHIIADAILALLSL